MLGKSREETVFLKEKGSISRKVVRLPRDSVIFTRVDPARRETSMLVRPRPGWPNLRTFLIGRGLDPRSHLQAYDCVRGLHRFETTVELLVNQSNVSSE